MSFYWNGICLAIYKLFPIFAPENLYSLKRDNYEAFIFVTYLYYTTAVGIAEAKEKAILIPTAHDEPYIHMANYVDVFTFCSSSSVFFL